MALVDYEKKVDGNVKIWYHINADKERVSVYPATESVFKKRNVLLRLSAS